MSFLRALGRQLLRFFPYKDILKKCHGCAGTGLAESNGGEMAQCPVCKGKPEVSLYLRRYYIIKTKWFRIYVHHIAQPDEDRDPHDHPWNFITFILSGGYTNEHWTWRVVAPCSYSRQFHSLGHVTDEVLRPGAVRYRNAEHVHRAREVLPNTWTLVFGGRKRRQWGFRDLEWRLIPAPEYLGPSYVDLD